MSDDILKTVVDKLDDVIDHVNNNCLKDNEQVEKLLFPELEKLGHLSELEKLQTRGKSPCDTCTLRGRKMVMYEGDLETAKVMFIGEAPGKEEADRKSVV